MDATLVVFLLVYVALAFGHLPGFKVDRTGAAVVGGLAMVSFGKIGPQAAWDAIDYRTVGLLFGLMVVSAAFVVSGFYAWTAERVATLDVRPPVLLAILVVVAGFLSSVLTNDVVVVAMTPLLVAITLSRALNPIPFLLAFCFAANTGSAGTIIGSPQNMIAAQGLGLSFTLSRRCRSSGALSRSSTGTTGMQRRGQRRPPLPRRHRPRLITGRPPRRHWSRWPS
jgi:Na+/H+ antiporter NhaD/arsenite permease-like protein